MSMLRRGALEFDFSSRQVSLGVSPPRRRIGRRVPRVSCNYGFDTNLRSLSPSDAKSRPIQAINVLLIALCMVT